MQGNEVAMAVKQAVAGAFDIPVYLENPVEAGEHFYIEQDGIEQASIGRGHFERRYRIAVYYFTRGGETTRRREMMRVAERLFECLSEIVPDDLPVYADKIALEESEKQDREHICAEYILRFRPERDVSPSMQDMEIQQDIRGQSKKTEVE